MGVQDYRDDPQYRAIRRLAAAGDRDALVWVQRYHERRVVKEVQ